MEKIYLLQNSAAPTVAAPVAQPTGVAIRTMLQIQTPATESITILEWGISFDGVTAANAPVKCELLGTTVGATMSTATLAADIVKFNQPNDVPGLISIGATTNTGFATAAVTEGTVANARIFDLQHISPTSGYIKQWPLGREPVLAASQYLRVRVTATVTVNAFIYVIWSE